MSIYQCEDCGCAENTALGWFWGTNLAGQEYDKKLCSACGPAYYKDGTKTGFTGEWHGEFERVFYPKGSMRTDCEGNLKPKKTSEEA